MKVSEKEKKRTLCIDCTLDPNECGENPLDCQKKAKLYFRLYDRKVERMVNYHG